MIQLLHGDCLERLRELPDNSVDACVTDPPYGLSFMGKAWDYDVPTVEVWREVLRVLKPGGHLLAFAGTRTQHRMCVNIEDAGFEIRDMIAWVYGSGFPKSMDVSKAIDRQRTEDKEPVRVICRFLRFCMDNQGLKSKDLTQHFGDCNPRLIDHWAARDTDSQPSLPTWEQWLKLKEVLALPDLHDAEVWRLNGRKGQPGDNFQKREVVGKSAHRSGIANGTKGHHTVGGTIAQHVDITAPATPEAQQWQGWGTALKPALEPITVARKPLGERTVAANVLEHGTGAINVDGCRVGTGADKGVWPVTGRTVERNSMAGPMGCAETDITSGRWPANLIHDGSDEVVGLFPDVKGQVGMKKNQGGFRFISGDTHSAQSFTQGRADSGSAARFFQQCKGDYDGVWQDLNLPPELASTADSHLSQQRQAVVSALVLAVSSALPEGQHCSGLSMEPSTNATGSELKTLEESVTQAILNIAPRFWHELGLARLSLTSSPVSVVVQKEPTGITTITASHWKSDGSAAPVTYSITPLSLAAGERDSVARFKYCAKASKADRDDGNTHPTVKPTELMRYLCRLVTPPGGVVLDPFMGSGSTGKAAALEGFRFIGIEREAEYLEIARQRVQVGDVQGALL